MTDHPPKLRVSTPSEHRDISTTPADQGVPLTQVLRHHGLPLNTRCGDRGLCEGCGVNIIEGNIEPLDTDDTSLLNNRLVKACRCRLSDNDLALNIPERSLARFDAHTVDDFTIALPHAHDPLHYKQNVDEPVGVAVDIGTTTVALMLVDLADGRVIARGGAFNRQIDYGDNVLTRINLCSTDSDHIAKLQEAVVAQTLAPVLDDALTRASVAAEQLVSVAVAGNPTMLHLLAGEDPSSMGVAPFTAGFLEHHVLTAGQIGLHLEGCQGLADVPCHLLPSASAYVGADIVAGVTATGMRYHKGNSLLVDVGTNGEMVLCHQGELVGCATAAGPAFEGAGLTDGVGAGDGAISHLSVQPNPLRFELETIGDNKPIGLCGSAYIDFLAQARSAGLLGVNGRFNPAVESELLIPGDYGRSARVAYGQGKRSIQVSESDIASLLQAKAAIAAGVLTLLGIYDLQPSDINTLYLAGGFGRHVNVANAIGCGLLPGFDVQQVKPVGNLSLAGAYLCLLDRSLLEEMSSSAEAISIIELNQAPAFEDRFIDQLMLT